MVIDEKAHIYNKLSAIYDKLFFVLRPGHKKVGEYLAREAIKDVLEVGIGTALTLEHYPKGTKITGVDMSEGMLVQAQEKLKDYPDLDVQLTQMDAQALEFADNSFECSYAPSLLSVVPEPQKLLAEMLRVTRPGGKIIIVCHFQGKRIQDAVFSKITNPLTQKLFGFSMDLDLSMIENFKGTKLISAQKVNNVGLFCLSHLIILEKLA